MRRNHNWRQVIKRFRKSQQRVVNYSIFVKPNHIPCSFPSVLKVPSLGTVIGGASLQIINCALDEDDDGV